MRYYTILLVLSAIVSPHTYADVQTDITAACSVGGTVALPPTINLNTTLYMRCAPGSIPVTLQGAPTRVTCQTGAAPCIVMSSTDPSGLGSRLNLKMKDLYLMGPGRAISGSEGIRILSSADESAIDNIRIENFDVGMRIGSGTDNTNLLIGVRVSNATISPIWSPSVNTSVWLDGSVGDAYFDRFSLNAYQTLIRSDGPGISGSSASFVDGSLNSTYTPGTPAVTVSTSDGSMHELLLAEIQDWETACPFLEVGTGARVVINGLAFSGDARSSGSQPTIKLTGQFGYLRISNANMRFCSGQANFIEVNNPLTYTSVTGSDLSGPISFFTSAWGTFTGNRWTTGPCLSGNTSLVRSAGNINCADR